MRPILLVAAAVIALGAFWAKTQGPAQYARITVAIELLGWDGFIEIARESVKTKIFGPRKTESRKQFRRLLDVLKEVDGEYCAPQRRILTDTEIAECHRYVTHLLASAFTEYYEADLDHPQFEGIVGPRMKLLGDNPDAFYYGTVFNADRDFIVTGRLQGEVYWSLTVYQADCVGCFSSLVLADINHSNLKSLKKDGSFEIVVSKKIKPEGEHRDWISINSIALNSYPQIITRHYYEQEVCAQLDPNLKQNLSIHAMESIGSRNPLTDTDGAVKLERVHRFVRSHTVEMLQDPSKAPSWFSFTPNKFGPAVLFRNEVVGLGAVDIVYSAGPWSLKNPDEEGVIIEALMPKAKFVNIVLWNNLLQTLAYEDGRTVSLNRKQMRRSNLNPTSLTGKVTILLSKRHPANGLPEGVEWLDSMGRHGGTMFWRFLLPEEEVETPTARVVRLDDL